MKITFNFEYCNSIEELNNKLLQEQEKYILYIELLELKLDSTPKILKEKVYEKIELIKERTHLKNVLLFYGLCGNVLGNIEQDFSDENFQVKILRDEDGEIADDCIGATIGGRKKYLNFLKSFKGIGTLILTPMGAMTTKEVYIEC